MNQNQTSKTWLIPKSVGKDHTCNEAKHKSKRVSKLEESKDALLNVEIENELKLEKEKVDRLVKQNQLLQKENDQLLKNISDLAESNRALGGFKSRVEKSEKMVIKQKEMFQAKQKCWIEQKKLFELRIDEKLAKIISLENLIIRERAASKSENFKQVLKQYENKITALCNEIKKNNDQIHSLQEQLKVNKWQDSVFQIVKDDMLEKCFAKELIEELKELLRCPISWDQFEVPVILPSGITIEERNFDKLVKRDLPDPYSPNFDLDLKITNRLALDLSYIVGKADKYLNKQKNDDDLEETFDSQLSSDTSSSFSFDLPTPNHIRDNFLDQKDEDEGFLFTDYIAQDLVSKTYSFIIRELINWNFKGDAKTAVLQVAEQARNIVFEDMSKLEAQQN